MDNGDPQNRIEKAASAWRSVGMVTGIGFLMAACVAIGLFTGRWLDEQWGTAPWLTVIVALFGAAAGFVQVGRIIKTLGD